MRRAAALLLALALSAPAQIISPTGGGVSNAAALTYTVITTGTLSSTQNDFSPTGLSTASMIRIAASQVVSITGLVAQSTARPITLVNVSNFPIFLHEENSGSTAANRFAFPAEVVLMPGESFIISYDTTSSRWRGPTPPSYCHNFANGICIYEEWPATSNSCIGSYNWVSSVSGSGASCANTVAGVDTTSRVFGNAALTTGTTTSGRSGMTLANSSIVIGAGILVHRFRVIFPTLSTVGEEYYFASGLGSLFNATGGSIAAAPTSGIYLLYDRVASGSDIWRSVTCASSSCTVNTGAAVTTTVQQGMIVVNAAGSSVDFYVRAGLAAAWTKIATHSATIPTTSTALGWGVKIEKTAGTTARLAHVDSWWAAYMTGQ